MKQISLTRILDVKCEVCESEINDNKISLCFINDTILGRKII